MKKITSILLVVTVLVVSLGMTAFAAEDWAHNFTVTADKTSVKSGDSVIVTIDLAGTCADISAVQYTLNYDVTKFSVDTTYNKKTGLYNCAESEWQTTMKNWEGLGWIQGGFTLVENETGALTFGIISVSGDYIDSESDIYDAKNAVAGKFVFTAIDDVDSIDSKCFNITGYGVQGKSNGTSTSTATQIQAAAPPVVEPEEEVDTVNAETDVEIGGNKYMGTAVYTVDFTLASIDTTKEYGIKVDGETVVSSNAISGLGSVKYILAYFGVSDTNPVGTVQSFWTPAVAQ